MKSTKTSIPLVLGSASTRRSKVLSTLGCTFEICPVEAEEIRNPADPVHTVVTNAAAKYNVCRTRRPDAAIIAADTLVWFDGRLIGKPVDIKEAAAFLRAFSGRAQVVYTGLAMGLPGKEPDLRVEATSVRFKPLTEATIQTYLEQTRPFDRAGAYDIDENGELLIAGTSGCYTNVRGRPEAPVRDWLAATGFI